MTESGNTTTDQPVSNTVVEAIADHRGVPPLELDPPLHTVIDCDALDQLYRHDTATPVTVSFTYDGLDITVQPDGRVIINTDP